jgi:serine/threonine protein kinase
LRCCPSCHRVFSEAIEFCAADGTELIEITDRRDPLVGHVLDGRYRLRSLLGAGGMGFVYLGEQIGLGREVAVKMLYAERTRDKNSVRRFRREALALAGIHHPCIIGVLEYGDGGGTTPYIVMEKVSGRALDEVILAMGHLAPRHAVHICAELADGLAAAHAKGVVHRDLKPSNVQLEARGEGVAVRILDFGLALLAETYEGGSTGGDRLTRQGVIFGTPEYMSPEQIKGKGADSRSDLYSLGCVLYEVLTGTPPYVGVTNIAVLGMHIEDEPPKLTLPDLDPGLVEDLDALVHGLLEKDPEKRLGDAARIARRLRDLEEWLPDPGPMSVLAASGPRDPRKSDATEPLEAPDSESNQYIQPFSGLGASADADRALEDALAASRRGRRVRTWLIVGVVGLLLVAAVPFVLAQLQAATSAEAREAQAEEAYQRLPPLAKAPRGRGIVIESGRVTEEIPGGEDQQAYEEARRALDRQLLGRGLRSRDLRAHEVGGRIWASQDAAARAGDYPRAIAELDRLGGLGRSVAVSELADLRLVAIDQELGSSRTPVEEATLRALMATVPRTEVPPEEALRFMARIDALEDGMAE